MRSLNMNSKFINLLTLSLFKSWIFLVDYIEFSISPDNLTINTSFLNGCLNFHTTNYLYLYTILPLVKS